MSSHMISYCNRKQGRKNKNEEQAGYAAEVWRLQQTIFDRCNERIWLRSTGTPTSSSYHRTRHSVSVFDKPGTVALFSTPNRFNFLFLKAISIAFSYNNAYKT